MMWPPPNIQSLPSKDELQKVKEEISTIELEIIDTELRLDALRKSLIERRTWIAPIRTIPHEILSLIFIQASRMDWKAPLVLEGVCRRWRDVVVDSPEAWSFISLSRYSILRRSNLISLFLERSRNTPLHINIGDDSLLEYMTRLNDRIECINLNSTMRVLPDRYLQRGHAFHRLERLKIDVWHVDSARVVPPTGGLAGWDMLLFPNLKVLQINSQSLSLTDAILGAPEFPVVQHLTVHCRGSWKLPNILTKCATSLESVDLTYGHWNSEGPDTEHEIDFPRLRYLRLVDQSNGAKPRLRLKAATPNLHIYLNEGPVSTLNTVKVDTAGIIILNVLHTIDLCWYPRLVTLSFNADGWEDEEVIKAIKCLHNDPALCPDLTLIEYPTRLTEQQMVKAKDALMARGKVTGQIIQLAKGVPKVREERMQALRSVETCGDHMPCNFF